MCDACYEPRPAHDWAAIGANFNWELLDNAIRYAILYPERFDMGKWAGLATTDDDDDDSTVDSKYVNGPLVGQPDNPDVVRLPNPNIGACGTVACLAGTALLLSGYSFAVQTADRWATNPGSFFIDAERMVTPDGTTVVQVPAAAYRELGITGAVAALVTLEGGCSDLFYGPDVAAVIEWRNALARLSGRKERSFKATFKAAKIQAKVDEAWAHGRTLFQPHATVPAEPTTEPTGDDNNV